MFSYLFRFVRLSCASCWPSVGGELQEGEEYDECINKICFKCKTIGSLALPLGLKIPLVHQWVYPTLYNVATLIPMPQKVLVRLRKYACLALNVTSLTVSLVGPSKLVSGGGRELINPELYCRCCTVGRWAHVQPLAKCLLGQATAAENKDLKPLL